jgi:hypothetical protein
MTAWMLVLDGQPTMYYDTEWDANCDAQHLRHTLGNSCPGLEIKRMTLSWK